MLPNFSQILLRPGMIASPRPFPSVQESRYFREKTIPEPCAAHFAEKTIDRRKIIASFLGEIREAISSDHHQDVRVFFRRGWRWWGGSNRTVSPGPSASSPPSCWTCSDRPRRRSRSPINPRRRRGVRRRRRRRGGRWRRSRRRGSRCWCWGYRWRWCCADRSRSSSASCWCRGCSGWWCSCTWPGLSRASRSWGGRSCATPRVHRRRGRRFRVRNLSVPSWAVLSDSVSQSLGTASGAEFVAGS